MSQKIAIIAGAGPAGLTAAYELLDKTDVKPIVFEATSAIGGIAQTVNYKGNRIDIGGHRFFSKSQRVVQWWQNILPLQGSPSSDDLILHRDIPLSKEAHQRSIKENEKRKVCPPDPEKDDKTMLVRQRLSHIYFLRKFFDYPISLNLNTFSNLGIIRIFRIGLSYMKARLFPIKNEKSLEDFLINRFGYELYGTFFKDYTEKVWGVPCHIIKPEWGAQRIKGLSISKAIWHAIKSIIMPDKSIGQKNVETSLIGQFTYPKYGPGQMWEETTRIVQDNGGEVYFNNRVVGVKTEGCRVVEVVVEDIKSKAITTHKADYFFSTMPVKHLVKGLGDTVPNEIKEVAAGLGYRDFITTGLLLKKLKIKNETKMKTVNDIVPDNWIYIQEPDVSLCRLQIFNNWSPYLVKDPDTIWIGLEYMCSKDEELWAKTDQEFTKFSISEIEKIGIIDEKDILDSVVIRIPKAYPAYFGTYNQFDKIRQYVNGFENMFLIGRNGMHRYNNQDHSMLTAMVAVENIINNVKTKDNIWNVNVEKDYHEEKEK